ncbi:MAG: hypothetical protein IKJ01_05920 [Lachnospiraceae bacterium]|nr:hypothetical protein [Lachnospiraceae bacterium]
MSKDKASQKINGNVGTSNARKRMSPILLLIPLLVIVVGIGMVFLFSKEDDTVANVVVTPENVEQIIAEVEEEQKVPIGSYEVSMALQWHFASGKDISSDAYIENVVNNNATIYCTAVLADTQEEVLKTSYIPVGGKLENITLDKKLSAGTYDAILTYHLVNSSYEDVSEVSVGFTIIIEN